MMNEMVPSYRVTELAPPEDRRNFIVKRYHQTWLERQLAKIDRLWCRMSGGDPVAFKPPFCWKCKAHWADLDQLWACSSFDCDAIDEKARARWAARERKTGGGSNLAVMALMGAGALAAWALGRK